MKYFEFGMTKEEAKKHYCELAKQYHPDKGGDAEIMKAVNIEYDEYKKMGEIAINVFKDELAKALKIFKAVEVPSHWKRSGWKKTIELVAEKDGVKINSHSEGVMISSKIRAGISASGHIQIDGDFLAKVIRAASGEDVKISVDGDLAKVKNSGANYQLKNFGASAVPFEALGAGKDKKNSLVDCKMNSDR